MPEFGPDDRDQAGPRLRVQASGRADGMSAEPRISAIRAARPLESATRTVRLPAATDSRSVATAASVSPRHTGASPAVTVRLGTELRSAAA